MALKPLHDAATIKRVVVSTYQSVSGAGKEAMDELFQQTRAVFTAGEIKQGGKFTKRIAFNVIPHIDVFMEDGYTKEEWKMVAETKKMLDPKIKLTATAVRVPVFIGHAEAVNVEFERPLSAERATEILRAAPGILVIDKRENGGYITPARGGGRGCHLHLPHPRGRDDRERPELLVRLGQPAQGRRPERGADRRSACEPQAHQAEVGGVSRQTLPSPCRGRGDRSDGVAHGRVIRSMIAYDPFGRRIMPDLERLTVTVPAEMAVSIRKAVEAGDYASTSEVMRAALRDWKTKRALQLDELAALKADIDQGLADVAAGRVRDFDSDRIVARGKSY